MLTRTCTRFGTAARLDQPANRSYVLLVPCGFDPAKNESNLAKHGVAFETAKGFDWATALVRADVRANNGEVRLNALGLIGDRLFHLTYTIRRVTWIISLRKASNTEIRRDAQQG